MLENAVAIVGLGMTVICGWIWFWFCAPWAEVFTFVGLAIQLFALYYMED